MSIQLHQLFISNRPVPVFSADTDTRYWNWTQPMTKWGIWCEIDFVMAKYRSNAVHTRISTCTQLDYHEM